jgi:hypothetical protein
MPESANAQVIIYVVLALVLIAAIFFGRRLRLRLGSFSAAVDAPDERKVNVANDTTFENAKVGKVTGGSDSAKEVNVMNRAVVRGGEIGDITGSVTGGAAGSDEKQ